MVDDPGGAQELPERGRVGRYCLGEILGRGGMGVVYRATDPEGREVAVKMLLSSGIRTRAERARFQREARIRIDHPNVVEVLDAGVDDGLPWIAFELLPGESLSERLLRGRLEVEEALRYGIAAAEGLAAAHAAQVVHRDLKPSNLFICEDGTVKIIDFGIARLDDEQTRLTATGSVLGTPTYLSPEQANGASTLDTRTDVWSLGVVLHEALAGRSPFERSTALATILAVMVEQAPRLTMVAPHVPPSFAKVVARCLEKRPEDRYADAFELLEALRTVDLSETPAGSSEIATAATSVSEPLHAPSITPGEQRVVAVLLADGVSDRHALESAVEEAGGTLIPVMGDRAIGLFGGEAWEGDEVERAVSAALEARDAARFMGVASGRAAYSGATGIAGSALVAAERACGMKLGGIAVDSTSARALSNVYTIKKVESGDYEITDRTSGSITSTLPPPARLRTVGREAEIAQLATALRTVREEERAVVVLVTGPPGIGKSHLRWELGRLIEDESDDHDEEPFLVLAARADPGRRGVGLGLWESVLAGYASWGAERHGWPRLHRAAPPEERQDAVRRVVQAAMPPGPAAEDMASFFGALLGVDVRASAALDAAKRDPQLMQDRLRLALVDWLAALSESAPIALLLEDVHWADEASLSLVEEISEHLGDAPILSFLTARPQLLEEQPELLAGASSTKLSLGGLSASQVEAFIGVILSGKTLPKPTIRALAERAAGNPLFVEQIVLAVREEGLLEEPLDRLPLPLTVEAAVQGRLDHLPSEEKNLCKRAALFARPFTSDDLEALGFYDAKRHLVSLTRRDIFASRSRPGPPRRREYRFRSTIVRDVAYRMMARALRDDLHLRLAEHLSSVEDASPEEIAQHYEYAGRGSDAAEWYARATVAAALLGDAPRTLSSADKALELGTPQSKWFELQMARSDALESLGRLEDQGRALDAALATAADDREHARALTGRAVSYHRLGDLEEALRVAERAVEFAEAASDDEVKAAAQGRMAVILAYAGRLDEAQEALAGARRVAPDSISTQVHQWRAQIASVAGDLAERRAAYRATVDGYASAGDVRRGAGAEMNLADVDNRLGDYEAAEAGLRDAVDKCRRLNVRLMEGYALANQGYSLSMLGRLAEAVEVLESAISLADESGDARLGVAARIYLSRALSDEPERALAEANRAVLDAGERDLDAMRALGLTAAAEAALCGGDADGALVLSGQAMALRDALGVLEEGEAELFLAHARAQEAAGHPEAAHATRVQGRERLLCIADQISDAELRRVFLENVQANRELLG